jgi:flagellar hook-basal body complex protein FliE
MKPFSGGGDVNKLPHHLVRVPHSPRDRIPPMAHSPAFTRFMESAEPDAARWRAGKGYDLDAVEEMTDDERAEAVKFLCDRQTITWREVEVLIILDPVVAEQALDRAEGKPPAEDSKPKKKKRTAEPKHTAAFKQFRKTIEQSIIQSDGVVYDITSLAEMTEAERAEIAQLLVNRGNITAREIPVLEAIDTAEARAAVDAASKDHLSVETRLAAATAMQAGGRAGDFEQTLAKQIRAVSRLQDGAARAMELAKEHPSETIKQALLWASWNQTECAPGCAATLCALCGKNSSDPALRPMLEKLGVHNSYFDRKKAFEELCKAVGMELDTSQQ